MMDTPIVVPGDRYDLEMMVRFGARRANTRRLRELLELTAAFVAPHVKARREAGSSFEGFAWSLAWQRRGGAWRLLRAIDAEDLAAAAEFERWGASLEGQRGIAMTGVDRATVIGGRAATAEILAGETITISAYDAERRHIAHDHVLLVRPDGSLGPPVPSLPARWPEGRAS